MNTTPATGQPECIWCGAPDGHCSEAGTPDPRSDNPKLQPGAQLLKGDTMDIELDQIRSHTTSTIRVYLSGAPDLRSDSQDLHIKPDHVVIEYTYRTRLNEGWKADVWYATAVSVSGHHILMPGPDGTERLTEGKNLVGWYAPVNVQDCPREPLPEWLDRLINELRPSGELFLAGV